MTVSPRDERYHTFLLAAMAAADADGVSVDKRHRMDAILQQHHPDLDGPARWARVQRALSRRPEVSGGLAFLRLIERSSQRLSQSLEGRSEALAVVRELADVAEADGRVSAQERLVLQAVINHIGLRDRLKMTVEDGRFILQKRSRSELRGNSEGLFRLR